MTSRYFGTAATMSAIRTRIPVYHTAELGGKTTFMDIVWAPSVNEMALLLNDAEGEASSRTASMCDGMRISESGEATPVPGLRIIEQRTVLTDVGGAEAIRMVQCMISYNDPDAPPGGDNPSQVLVARYVGKPPPQDGQSERALHYQVQAATGSWWRATDVFVRESAQGRLYTIGRTPTQQRADTASAAQ